MGKRKLKTFTLLETIIVLVIIWILWVVLCESYITVSKVSLQVEQQKNLSEEALTMTQIFQSIADEATIDYNKYSELNKSDWYTDTLYLAWGDRDWTSIYIKGENCFPLFLDQSQEWESNPLQDYNTDCKLALSKDGKETILTTDNVIISNTLFRIIPYDSIDNYFENWWELIINEIHQPAFRVFTHLYAPLYQNKWTNKIDQPLQLFFNLKWIDSRNS